MSGNAGVGKVFNLTYGDMAAFMYDPTGKQTDVYAYAESMVKAAMDELYDNLLKQGSIYHSLADSDGNSILDSEGNEVLGRLAISIR